MLYGNICSTLLNVHSSLYLSLYCYLQPLLSTHLINQHPLELISYLTSYNFHFLQNITKENISKRIKELCYIINQNTNMVSLNTHHTHYMNMGHSNANNIEFQVNTPEFVNIAMSSITPVIQKHTIVQLGACKKIPKSKNEYKKVARNRLNRNKPKFLGNFVFAPLIFDQLYQVKN